MLTDLLMAKEANMEPTLVETEVTRKSGVACDFVVFSVERGREAAWAETARRWAASHYKVTSVKVRAPGRIAVLISRRNPHRKVNGDRVVKAITQQFQHKTRKSKSTSTALS
jgi:hypothetical protein